MKSNYWLINLLYFLVLNQFVSAQKLILGSEKEGICSYYADKFDGLKTSSGDLYNKLQYTAAHRYLEFNTLVAVTNLKTNKTVIVRINDRGPYIRNRLIDVSGIAAHEIGLKKLGVTRVKMRVVGFDNFQYLQPIDPPDSTAEILNLKIE